MVRDDQHLEDDDDEDQIHWIHNPVQARPKAGAQKNIWVWLREGRGHLLSSLTRSTWRIRIYTYLQLILITQLTCAQYVLKLFIGSFLRAGGSLGDLSLTNPKLQTLLGPCQLWQRNCWNCRWTTRVILPKGRTCHLRCTSTAYFKLLQGESTEQKKYSRRTRIGLAGWRGLMKMQQWTRWLYTMNISI